MHTPVFFNEIKSLLKSRPLINCVDATSGYGGHLSEILKNVSENGRLLGFDRDSFAIKALKQRFADELAFGKLLLINKTFSKIAEETKNLEIEGKIDFLLADLGVSSPQIDQAERGFSFNKNGPLDMRMSQESDDRSAEDLVNDLSEEELANIFFTFGEERYSRRIARNIVEKRSLDRISSTQRLAEIVRSAIPTSKANESQIHPATRTFMALRIAVNHELEEVETLLKDAPNLLAPGGLLAIISFHSLEDRLIKHKFKELANPNAKLPRHLPIQNTAGSPFYKTSNFTVLKPFPFKPTEAELKENPRSRSAKLRVLQKTS